MHILSRRELFAGLIAVLAISGCLWLEARAEEVEASTAEISLTEAPEAGDCLDFVVRIHEDNGWVGVKKINPPRFYCGKGYSLDGGKDGLIICRCTPTE